MSKFKTTIPVDVDAIKNALPPRSFVNGIEFNGREVVVNWENDDYRTPYTFPVEWPDMNQVPVGVQHGPREAQKAALPRMYAPVSGPQNSSASQTKAKPDDAAPVKKKSAK